MAKISTGSNSSLADEVAGAGTCSNGEEEEVVEDVQV